MSEYQCNIQFSKYKNISHEFFDNYYKVKAYKTSAESSRRVKSDVDYVHPLIRDCEHEGIEESECQALLEAFKYFFREIFESVIHKVDFLDHVELIQSRRSVTVRQFQWFFIDYLVLLDKLKNKKLSK